VSRRGSASLIVAILAWLLWPGSIAAQVTQTVDFEDHPYSTTLDQAYQSLGLSIPGARIDTVPRAQSGNQVARMVNSGAGQPPMVTLFFATPQLWVSFYAGSSAPGRAFVSGQARAYDANGNEITRHAEQTVSKGSCATRFVLRTGSPSISRVEFQLVVYNPTAPGGVGTGLDIAIDELTFNGPPPPPPPPQQTHVPDLARMTPAEAIVRLKDSALTLKYEPTQPKLPGPGTVIHQDPPPGTPIAVGESVSITLGFVDTTSKQRPKPDSTQTKTSKPKPLFVPNLRGRTPPEADSILTGLHLVLGGISVGGDSGAPGTITDQFPAAKSHAKPGDTVIVIIVGKPARPPWPRVPWWWWVAGGAAAAAGASAGVKAHRRRLHRRRMKAKLVADSLVWRDTGPAEPAPLVCEVRFRVTLGLGDDDRAGPP